MPAYHQQQIVIPQRRERRLSAVSYPGEATCIQTMEPAKFHSDSATASEKLHG